MEALGDLSVTFGSSDRIMYKEWREVTMYNPAICQEELKKPVTSE
jgi:hypothetical protein